VSAGAGSGKTLLLRSWIDAAGLAGRTAWVSVQGHERDPQRFWISVINALRDTTVGPKLVRPVTAAPALDGWVIIERLLEDLGALQNRIWLVIDDLHELRSVEAQRQLELLVMRAPPELRFVLATRHDLRLGLHRLRLKGQLTEIRDADLRFTADEARELLNAAGVKLPDSAIALLLERTEGWAAGLRLAALSLSEHPDPERFAAEFSGSERTVAEYLLAEVLERQSKPARRLLLRTSMLERVNGELADLLSGGSGGERILQDLEEANAFVTSLDARRSWFRYHPLFADLLQLELRRTAPGEIPALHDAATGWFAWHGYPVDAVCHAQAAQDWDLAARLLSDHWFGLWLNGQAATAHELLTGFPAGVVAGNAELIALMAADELDRGSLEEAERYLALATRELAPVPADRRGRCQFMLAILRLMRGRRRGNLPAVVEQAQRLLAAAEAPAVAQAGLGADLRALALINLGIAELWADRLGGADRHIRQGLTLARRIGRPYLEIMALAHGAMIASFRASFAYSADQGMQAIELARQHGWSEEPIAGIAYVALGITRLWQGRLEEAERWIGHADRTLPAEAEPAAGLMLHAARGLLERARGRDEEALAAFRAAGPLAELLRAPHALPMRMRVFLLQSLVRRGETRRAEQVLAELDARERETAEMRTVIAALRLAQDDPQAATVALAPVLDGSVPVMEPQVWLVKALLQEAIARDRLGDTGAAERALERALDLAEPDGVLLWFLLHPAPGLLKRHRQYRTAHAALITEILNLLAGGKPASPPGGPEPLRERLSHSETRILRYLPTNLPLPEIARELSLSVGTVKTHTKHIYAKLGAHSRSEAVERARAHGLLAPSMRALRTA
jgi:LuxR family maltose regulon positive regulatory protein